MANTVEEAVPGACAQVTGKPVKGMPAVYYPLHSLLETLRALERHESELCGLCGEVQRSGKLGARGRKELTAILENLPLASLQQEVDAVWVELEKG